MTGRLEGLVAVVTGAGRGLGRSVALGLAREGAKVVVNDIGAATSGEGRDQQRAQGVVDQIVAEGGEAVANPGDISEPRDAQVMTDQAISTYGQLDILVNAAGNLRLGTIVDTTPEDFDAIIRVHLRGYYNTSHFAARHWVERGEYGRLINFISMAALVSYPSLLAYSSAKAGIVGLTRSSANALVSYNVTANCVRPSASTGMSDTDDPASRLLYERSGKLASEQAVGTLADPEHMVPLIVYLASPAAGHISGRLFEGRGGHYALWSEPAPERILNCDFLSDPQQTYDGLEKELGAGLTLQDLKAPMPPLDELGDWKTKYGTLVPTWDFRRGV